MRGVDSAAPHRPYYISLVGAYRIKFAWVGIACAQFWELAYLQLGKAGELALEELLEREPRRWSLKLRHGCVLQLLLDVSHAAPLLVEWQPDSQLVLAFVAVAVQVWYQPRDNLPLQRKAKLT